MSGNDGKKIFSGLEECSESEKGCYIALTRGHTGIIDLMFEKKQISVKGSVLIISKYLKEHNDPDDPTFTTFVDHVNRKYKN